MGEELSLIQRMKEDKIELRKKIIKERLDITLSLFYSFLAHIHGPSQDFDITRTSYENHPSS